MKSSENAMLTVADQPFPTAVQLVLRRYGALVDTRGASALALEAAVAAMAPATKAAITADLKCFLAWCDTRRPTEQAVPATPETLVHYLRWLSRGSETRPSAKPATLARRIASIARVHRILRFGEKEPLPTQAGMGATRSKASTAQSGSASGRLPRCGLANPWPMGKQRPKG